MKPVLITPFVCLVITAGAQQPAFEVASIKPSNYQGGPLRVTARVGADGIDFSNVTPRLCIQRAYGVRPYQLIGPDWINTDRYMIIAKAAGAVPEDQVLMMLRTLLVERFRLASHRESREMPVYALVVSRNGTKLKEATDEGATQIGPGREDHETLFERASMEQLAGVVGRSLDRPVINATGLKGLYNFTLAWANEGRARPNAPAAEGSAVSDSDNVPSIFSALQEQLGLKLEARKAPVEVLVIDHIGRPSEN
jgi:uncharacterized protein (TIGR03435 family)